MPERVLVSILIVNFRTYVEIAACLESLQPFIGPEVEAIVVDHQTEPASARELSSRFPWMTLLDVAVNAGFAAGVNRAARAAQGRYLLLLNPDCVVQGNVARVLAEWLDAHPRVGAVGALVRDADGSVQASARRFPDFTTGLAGRTTWLTRLWPRNPWSARNLPARDGSAEPIEVDWVSGACLMIRREAFEQVGGLDEQFFLYWEDADLCYRLKQAGWLTVYNPMVGVIHLTGRSSAQARRRSLVAFHRSAYRYFRKHGGRWSVCTAPLVYVVLQARLLMKLASIGLREGGRR